MNNAVHEIVLEKIAESIRYNTTVRMEVHGEAYAKALLDMCYECSDEGEIDGYQGEKYVGLTEDGAKWSILLLSYV